MNGYDGVDRVPAGRGLLSIQATLALVLPACFVGLCPAAGRSQETTLEKGTRVRVQGRHLAWERDTTSVPPASLVGYVLRAGPDSLWMRPGRYSGDTIAAGWPRVQRLEVSLGRRPKTLTGALIGTVAGTGIGVLVAQAMPDCDPAAWFRFFEFCASGADDRTLVTLLGTAVGSAAGAYLGSRSTSERWRNVPLPDLRVTVGATEVGLVFRVPVRF